MKKKLLSLLLALACICQLALPALAADTEPPMWQQMGYESREQFCEMQGDYSCETGERIPLSDEEYDAFATLFGERLAFIQGGGDFWSEAGYGSYEAMYAEYEGWMISDEAEFERQMAFDYALGVMRMHRYEEEHTQARAALGFTPGGVGLQLNGEALSASGEYANGSTYAPVRALAEALGGEANFEADTQTVTVTRADVTLSFPLGSATMTVSDGEEERAVQLPAPVYERDGSSYIPVRAFSEALGLTVGWDENFEAAILLDRAALTAEIDEDFTSINRVFAAQEPRDMDRVYRTVAAVTGTVTLFDTINGDEALPVSADMTVVSAGESVSLDAKVDLRALTEWLLKESGDTSGYLSFWEDMMRQMYTALAELHVQVILDYDEDTVYVRSPQLVGLLVEQAGETAVPEGAAALSKDAWYMFKDVGLRSEIMQDMMGRMDESFGVYAASVGDLVYSQVLAGTWNGPDDVYFCDRLNEKAGAMRAYMGDARFTEEGGTLKLTLDSAKLGDSEDDQQLAYQLDNAGVKSLTVTCAVAKDGKVSGAAEMHIKPLYGTELLLKLRFRGDRDDAALDLTYHVKNSMEVELHLDLTVAEQKEAPSFKPPEGAQIVDASAFTGL